MVRPARPRLAPMRSACRTASSASTRPRPPRSVAEAPFEHRAASSAPEEPVPEPAGPESRLPDPLSTIRAGKTEWQSPPAAHRLLQAEWPRDRFYSRRRNVDPAATGPRGSAVQLPEALP